MSLSLLSNITFSQLRLPLSSESHSRHSTDLALTGFLWRGFRGGTVILSAMVLAIVAIVLSGCGSAGAHAAAKIPASTESSVSQTLRIATTALPVASVDGAYTAALLATGGVPPYSWVKTSGELPNGLTLNSSTGAISGMPTIAGSFSFGAKVVDSSVDVAATDFSLNVSVGPIPAVTSVSPNRGSAEGGTEVTVDGSNFGTDTAVQFGGIAAQSVRIVNASQLQAVTPAQSAAKVTVVVENSDGQVANVPNGFTYTEPANPAPANPATPETATLNADIVVDVSRTVSDTGGDDVAAAKNIFASASAPEADGDLFPDWSVIASEFSMKRMRNINGLADCALDATGKLTGCSRLNNDLMNMQHFGITPHVVVGQNAPASIGGNPKQWTTAQWVQYDALAYAIVNYVAVQFGGRGFPEALFEVENEIDITTDPTELWLTTSSHVAQGDPSRFTQFDTVYSHWAKAVDAVAKQNPSRKIRIAGPATGFWTVVYGSGQMWQTQIVQKYAQQHTRLDVVSLHQYGADALTIAKNAQAIRKALNDSGMSNTEIWITEWGPSYVEQGVLGAINASHVGGAWAVSFLLQALKGTVTGGSYLEVRDNQGHDTTGSNSNIMMASWNHRQNNEEYPKPIANVFSMIDRMSGTRKLATVTSNKPNLYSLASSDSSSASLIVSNFNYTSNGTTNTATDNSSTETVTVGFKDLPFNGSVTVDRYLVDATTSNLTCWFFAGKTPPSVNVTQLQKVESFNATATGGTVALPARQLGQSAVSLWIVHQ